MYVDPSQFPFALQRSVGPNGPVMSVVRYGVSEIIEADRELVESGCEEMLDRAKDQPWVAISMAWWMDWPYEIDNRRLNFSWYGIFMGFNNGTLRFHGMVYTVIGFEWDLVGFEWDFMGYDSIHLCFVKSCPPHIKHSLCVPKYVFQSPTEPWFLGGGV